MISAAQRAVYRMALLDAGFAPIPLNGKRPVLDDWPTLIAASAADIERWGQERPGAANTGYLTRLAPTLDIDIQDPEAADAVESLVKDHYGDLGAVLVRVGKPPKRAIPFKTDQPFPKIVVSLFAPNGHEERIELLAEGQQCVVDGIHPDTGKAYRWLGGAPGKVRRDELPFIDAEAAQELVDNAVELLIAEHGYRRKQELLPPKPNGAGPHVVDTGAWGFLGNPIDHGELTAGAMRLLQAGMHDAAAVNLLRNRVESLVDVDEDRRRRRLSEIPAMVASARAKLGEPQPDPANDARPGPAPAGGDDGRLFAPLAPLPIAAIPPRRWAYGHYLLFGSAAVLGASDGVGKGVITVGVILSMITGQALLGERVWRRGPTAVVTYEDDEMEWRRRIAAGCLYHRLDYDQVIQSVHFVRRPRRVSFGQMYGGQLVFPDSEAIIADLLHVGAAVLVIDPFNNAHALESGNENVVIARVAAEISRIAERTDSAVLANHHLRKGAVGSVDDLMGATALRANFRSCRILMRMTTEQAELLNIPTDETHRYVRIAGSKENYAPPPERSAWFKLQTQALGNATDEYPDGDEAPVAIRWEPPVGFAGVSLPKVKAIFDALRAGPGEGWFYSPDRRANHAAVDLIVDKADVSEAQAGSMLKMWLEHRVLRKETYLTPKARNRTSKLVLDENKVAAILAPLRVFDEDLTDL